MATLQEYLDAQDMTQTTFGLRAGVRQQVVSRWCSGERIPRPAFMATVQRLTGGQVTAQDFYRAHAARTLAYDAGRRAGLAAVRRLQAQNEGKRIPQTTLAEVFRQESLEAEDRAFAEYLKLSWEDLALTVASKGLQPPPEVRPGMPKLAAAA